MIGFADMDPNSGVKWGNLSSSKLHRECYIFDR